MSVDLWKAHYHGQAPDYRYKQQVKRLEGEVTHHLRDRILKDADNQRLLDGIGLHHDRGNLLRFPAGTLRGTDQQSCRTGVAVCGNCSCQRPVPQNDRGAEAYAAFTSDIRPATKNGVFSIAEHLTAMSWKDQPPNGSP